MKPKRKTVEYVNNQLFFEEMVKYKTAVEAFKQRKSDAQKAKIVFTEEKPAIPEFVGECIMLIAKKLSNSPKFNGYSFREEMELDGIENCILYIDNFDPKKSDKPFAYFTQIIWYSFLRRIQREKKQAFIKAKNLQNFLLLDDLNEDIMGKTDKMMPTDAMNDLIKAFEKSDNSKKKKKANTQPVGLEKYIGSDSNE